MSDANRIGILLFLYSRRELSVTEEYELSEWRRMSNENETLFKEIADQAFTRRLMSDFYKEREEVFLFLKNHFQTPGVGHPYENDEEKNDPLNALIDEEENINIQDKYIVGSDSSHAIYWSSRLEENSFSENQSVSTGSVRQLRVLRPTDSKKERKPYRIIRRMLRIVAGVAAFLLTWEAYDLLVGDHKPKRFQMYMGMSHRKLIKQTDYNRGWWDGFTNISHKKLPNGDELSIYTELKKAAKDEILRNVTYTGNETILQLPIGVTVWLYPNSAIFYPAHFTSDTIHLGIRGKIYFESSSTKKLFITKNNSAPESGDDEGIRPVPNEILIQSTPGVFDITARPRDSTVTVNLVSGSALISLKDQSNLQPMKIEAGQQITVGRTIHPLVPAADSAHILSIKNGEMNFNNATLKDVMYMITQWYEVEVEFGENANPDRIISFRIPLDSKISAILDSLKGQGVQLISDRETIKIFK